MIKEPLKKNMLKFPPAEKMKDKQPEGEQDTSAKKRELSKKEQVFALIFRDLHLYTRTETDRTITQAKILMLRYLGIDLGFKYRLCVKGYESEELITTLESPLYFLSVIYLPKTASLKPGVQKKIARIQDIDDKVSNQILNRADAFRIIGYVLTEKKRGEKLSELKEKTRIFFPEAGEKLISYVFLLLTHEGWLKEPDAHTVQIAGFTQDSIVDGPGIRSVIWMQGCRHQCPQCHNPQTHDPEGGIPVKIEDLVKMVNKNHYHSGLTLSGGEPMDQAEALADMLRKMNPRPNVWCYTGYRYEECLRDTRKKKLLQFVDVLVDGRFIAEQMPGGKWRGSANQRLIDVPKSLREGKAVEIIERLEGEGK